MKKNIFFLFFPILLYSQDKFKKAFETKESIVYLKEIGNYKAWLKAVKKTQKIKLKNGKYKTIGGDYLIQLISCDCGEKKISLGKTITYNKNGDVLQEFNYDSPFEYVIPETQGEEILNIVCGWSEYAIDIELKQLYSEYSKIFDEIDEETFYNSYNQFGEVYLNLVREKIKKNK